MVKQQNLRAVVASLRPIVRDLLLLEADSRGIETQFSRVPLGHVGVDGPLEACQSAIDKRFEKIVGAKPFDFAHPDVIRRRLLDTIDALAHAVGVDLDTGRLERDYKIWTDDPALYDVISHSRSVLGVKVKLNPDGSRRRG
jgi:hypothetical protein